MTKLWGSRDGINKAWLGPNAYVFLSKASTVESILCSNRHIDKSSDYRFLQPWLGTGLLTGSGKQNNFIYLPLQVPVVYTHIANKIIFHSPIRVYLFFSPAKQGKNGTKDEKS